jgi:transposase InsO family protein
LAYEAIWDSTLNPLTTLHYHEFIEILDEYLRWYNEERIKMSLGGKSPLEYRRSLGLAA